MFTEGTGDVLKIQSLLHVCSEHYANPETEEKTETTAASSTSAASSSSSTKGAAAAASTDDQSSDSKKKKAKATKSEPGSLAEPGSHQGLATIGIALLAMGEKIGMDMCLRMYNHLVRPLLGHRCALIVPCPIVTIWGTIDTSFSATGISSTLHFTPTTLSDRHT